MRLIRSRQLLENHTLRITKSRGEGDSKRWHIWRHHYEPARYLAADKITGDIDSRLGIYFTLGKPEVESEASTDLTWILCRTGLIYTYASAIPSVRLSISSQLRAHPSEHMRSPSSLP